MMFQKCHRCVRLFINDQGLFVLSIVFKHDNVYTQLLFLKLNAYCSILMGYKKNQFSRPNDGDFFTNRFSIFQDIYMFNNTRKLKFK